LLKNYEKFILPLSMVLPILLVGRQNEFQPSIVTDINTIDGLSKEFHAERKAVLREKCRKIVCHIFLLIQLKNRSK